MILTADIDQYINIDHFGYSAYSWVRILKNSILITNRWHNCETVIPKELFNMVFLDSLCFSGLNKIIFLEKTNPKNLKKLRRVDLRDTITDIKFYATFIVR